MVNPYIIIDPLSIRIPFIAIIEKTIVVVPINQQFPSEFPHLLPALTPLPQPACLLAIHGLGTVALEEAAAAAQALQGTGLAEVGRSESPPNGWLIPYK